MSFRLPAALGARGAALLRRRPAEFRPALRRLAWFWVVWSALLLVHEGGHAWAARAQGQAVRRVTVGAGPVLWRGDRDGTQLVLRLVPLAGFTTLGKDASRAHGEAPSVTSAWRRHAITLAGGVAATLALALATIGLVALWERARRVRWVTGRMLVADAVVLTIFNFLPVPPLDGGRLLLDGLATWRGAALPADTLFWVQVGGLALSVVPMAIWTRWTARIDRVAMTWGAPQAGSGNVADQER